QGVPPESWRPTYNPPGVSTFTGSATYNYAIPLPPGIGGLQPSLSLSYSSRGVDSKEDPVQGAGPGLGWSFSLIEITNSTAAEMYIPEGGCGDGRPGYTPYGYNLILNGASYRL